MQMADNTADGPCLNRRCCLSCGVALSGNPVLGHSLAARLIASNKNTGHIAWQRQVAGPAKSEVITRAAS